jgi:hypothetical protein
MAMPSSMPFSMLEVDIRASWLRVSIYNSFLSRADFKTALTSFVPRAKDVAFRSLSGMAEQCRFTSFSSAREAGPFPPCMTLNLFMAFFIAIRLGLLQELPEPL